VLELKHDPHSPNKTVQLTNSILERRTGQTPLVVALQFKRALGSVGRPLLDIMRLIELHASRLNQPPNYETQRDALTIILRQ
jgi:hypothetical protein